MNTVVTKRFWTLKFEKPNHDLDRSSGSGVQDDCAKQEKNQ
jgi:hypothetical protein